MEKKTAAFVKMIGGGMSQSRWGINVEEDLGGGSKALVTLENRFDADSGTPAANAPFFQLAHVGLQGPYGRLTAGRQWNVLFDVVTSTYASFPYSPYMEAYKPELGMAMGARTSNMLKYTFATPDRSFVGSLQYSFDENNDTKALEAGLPASAASRCLPMWPARSTAARGRRLAAICATPPTASHWVAATCARRCLAAPMSMPGPWAVRTAPAPGTSAPATA
jgi:predicted porin